MFKQLTLFKFRGAYMKKRWKKPMLITLVKVKPDEMVLGSCKVYTFGGGALGPSDGGLQGGIGCSYGNIMECSLCFDSVSS